MTDAQFEKIKKGLIFHSENGIDNLCTLTETALRELLDEVSKDKVVEHFEAYGQCRDSRRISDLEAQIEKMKCCGNCDVGDKACYVRTQEYVNICPSWKLKEIKEK